MQTKPVDLSFFKILAVLDGPAEALDLAAALKSLNLPFKVVASREEASLLLDGERFDLLIVEFVSNSEAGAGVCQAVRGSEASFRNVPILAYSESGVDESLIRSAGVNDFILKPASSECFREKLQSWADRIFEALPVLQESSIDKIRMFDDEEHTLLTSLFQIYSENTRSELVEIEKLVKANEIDLLRKKAHKLKSSAAQLGAFRFEKYCNLMEYDPTLDQVRAQQLYLEMVAEYEKSLNEFDHYCQKYVAPSL